MKSAIPVLLPLSVGFYQLATAQDFDAVTALAAYGVNVSDYAAGGGKGSLETRTTSNGCIYSVRNTYVTVVDLGDLGEERKC